MQRADRGRFFRDPPHIGWNIPLGAGGREFAEVSFDAEGELHGEHQQQVPNAEAKYPPTGRGSEGPRRQPNAESDDGECGEDVQPLGEWAARVPDDHAPDELHKHGGDECQAESAEAAPVVLRQLPLR